MDEATVETLHRICAELAELDGQEQLRSQILVADALASLRSALYWEARREAQEIQR